jgi:fido (protein-threonine AMPylation protein)
MMFVNRIADSDRLQEEIRRYSPLKGEELNQLIESFRIGLTWASNALAGNSLTENETKMVVERRIATGGKRVKDYLEAIGHAEAFDYLQTLIKRAKVTEQDILKLHKLLFRYRINQTGTGHYHTQNMATGADSISSRPSRLKNQLAEFANRIPSLRREKHPIVFAALLHLHLITIHPFADGNGRTARLLMNLALQQAGYPVTIIPPVLWSEYLSAVNHGKSGNSEPFVALLSNLVWASQRDYLRLLQDPKRLNSEKATRKPDISELQIFTQFPEFDFSEVIEAESVFHKKEFAGCDIELPEVTGRRISRTASRISKADDTEKLLKIKLTDGLMTFVEVEPPTPALGLECSLVKLPMPRFIQSQVLHELDGVESKFELPFMVGQKYTVVVRIGPQDVAWLSPDEQSSFPDELLPKGEKSELTVFFSEPHHSPVVQRSDIVLPPTGASTECRFDFGIKSHVKVFEGRILVTYRNRILQTALLTGGVVEHDGKKGKKPKLTAEVVLSANLHELEYRPGFDLAMVINHNADNVPRLTKLSGGTCLVCNVDGIQNSINVIRNKLEDVTTNAPDGDSTCALMSPETRNLLYSLAAHGRVLFDAIVTDQVGNNWLSKKPERIQLVSALSDSYLPIEFIYDKPVPIPDSALCPKAAESLVSGNCGSCLIPDGSPESEFICPIGFWGLSRVIERHAHDRRPSEVTPQEPSAETPPLDILRNCLFAASDKVDSVKSGLSSQLLNKINKVTGNAGVMVKSWPAWKQKIKELHPSLLLLVPHTLQDDILSMPAMEIGMNDRLASVHVTAPYVRADSEIMSSPVVALLGCETVMPFSAYMGFIPPFRRNGAALVLATLTPVLGRQVVPVAEKLLEELRRLLDGATEPMDFGDVLLSVRRKAMLDGMPVVLSLVGYGDTDWKFTKGA